MAGLYEWKFISNDFDQGVWTVALFSDQYQTIDGYGAPVDYNPSRRIYISTIYDYAIY